MLLPSGSLAEGTVTTYTQVLDMLDLTGFVLFKGEHFGTFNGYPGKPTHPIPCVFTPWLNPSFSSPKLMAA